MEFLRTALKWMKAFRARMKGRPLPACVRETLILMARFVAVGTGVLSATGFALLIPAVNEHGWSLLAGLLAFALTLVAQFAWEFSKLAEKLAAERP
ncbi:hypothetical protein [Ensifer sp. LCM 4579]|uniref:hypothetical protein n=1 Tax=Ensifer sp. LCM 4579 TaxID=1848292 RepID=UPI0008DA9DFA|nr:hypothetical protein [Ensifer sp. LCM 4579]OHV83311.1 hypothetical protein LCM4579_16490 [Ensifer sp. LCM 4579]